MNKYYNIDNRDLPLQQYGHYQDQFLPDLLGHGQNRFYLLDNGFNCIKTYYTPKRDLSLLNRIDDGEEKLIVSIGIKGNSRFVSKSGKALYFNQGYTTVSSFSSTSGERQYDAEKEVIQLRLSLNKAFISRYFSEQQSKRIFNNKNINMLSYHPVNPQSLLAAQQMLNYEISGPTQKMFMQGQALSILSAELSHIFSAKEQQHSSFSPADKEIANTARDILFTEFRQPPSIQELASRVGTNQHKLKKLFHHFFNNTPYGLLLEIRMKTAYQLLLCKQCHVAVAADHVGYRHASNFSTAFIKFFGISPKHISKKHPDYV